MKSVSLWLPSQACITRRRGRKRILCFSIFFVKFIYLLSFDSLVIFWFLKNYEGKKAKDVIEEARNNVARLLHVSAKEIFFTSGGTEVGISCFSFIITSNQREHYISLTQYLFRPTAGWYITVLNIGKQFGDRTANHMLSLPSLSTHQFWNHCVIWNRKEKLVSLYSIQSFL